MARNLGLVAAMLLLAPLSAQAVGIEIVGVSSTASNARFLGNGDTITFDLRLNNATSEAIFGLGIEGYGYDSDNNGLADNGLAFVSGSVAGSAFNPVPGFGGVQNTIAAAEQVGRNEPGLPIEPLRATLFSGITTDPTATGDGGNDPGVDGALVSAGDVHFRVTFQAIGGIAQTEVRTLIFGDNLAEGAATIGNGGVILPFTNASYSVRVVPEPGTALLMGLGLAALAGQRRRQ